MTEPSSATSTAPTSIDGTPPTAATAADLAAPTTMTDSSSPTAATADDGTSSPGLEAATGASASGRAPQPASRVRLSGHAVLDPQRGRVYAAGVDSDGRLITAVYSTADGRQVEAFDVAGVMALDVDSNVLYVERVPGGGVAFYGAQDDPHPMFRPGPRELVAVRADDGSVVRTVPLADAASPQLLVGPALAPLFDPVTNQVLVFREHQVLRVAPTTGETVATFDTNVTFAEDDPRAGEGPVPIARAFIDPPSRIFYLTFVTLRSAPWTGHTIMSHHLDTFVARGRGDYPTATYPTAAGGRLFGQLWNRAGFTSAFQWRDGAPFSTRMGAAEEPIGTAVDLETDRLFAANTTHLRVLDAENMAPQHTLPHGLQDARDVWLTGFDDSSDGLVFVADGELRLVRWPE
ncbi:MAG: hypothetical protein ACK2T6_08260 [Anaerolineae bacterium]